MPKAATSREAAELTGGGRGGYHGTLLISSLPTLIRSGRAKRNGPPTLCLQTLLSLRTPPYPSVTPPPPCLGAWVRRHGYCPVEGRPKIRWGLTREDGIVKQWLELCQRPPGVCFLAPPNGGSCLTAARSRARCPRLPLSPGFRAALEAVVPTTRRLARRRTSRSAWQSS